MVSSTLVKFASKRIPLIKFRKGGLPSAGTSGATAEKQASASSPAQGKVKTAATSNAIEDWELPPRYWRKPIDPVEMDYINRGGPA